MNDLQRLYTRQNYFNLNLSKEIEQAWEKRKATENNSLSDMGLLKGWATEGLLQLTKFNQTDVLWILLL